MDQTLMNNTITRKSIFDLMHGDYFYVPAYQRGYRWTPTQVTQLLRDLFSYANEQHDNGNIEGDYYCLQPVVARKVTDEDTLNKILGEEAGSSSKNVWEIIDGQQRLTTIYILYKYLMDKERIDDEQLYEDYGGLERYHIIYATRKGSGDFLEKLGPETVDEANSNIDYFHMQQAYDTIDKWIRSIEPYDGKNGAMEVCRRYNVREQVKEVRSILFDLLNAEKGKKNATGTAQVLWYELSEDADAIAEFRNINTGKIYLTDAELIKALFLKTEHTELQERIQLQRAMEWEHIENTLHDDTFWYFLNRKGVDIPNRIDFIFRLIYKTRGLEDLDEQEIEAKLAERTKELEKKNVIFNFYYDMFDGLSGDDLKDKIQTEWDNINDVFHILEDWYEDCVSYNLIGMVSQSNDDLLPNCYIHFMKMDPDQPREEFKTWLQGLIRQQLEGVKVEEGQIQLSYGDPRVFYLLLLLNVNHLNRQALNSPSQNGDMGQIYKFPFAVLTTQKWDIEHIDSYTTNGLKEIAVQKQWVETAMADLHNTLEPEDLHTIEDYMEKEQWMDAIKEFRRINEEEEADEDTKNSIGNLTLLDAGTNRAYGNSLFVVKRKTIIDRMKNGVYIPESTAYVFMKLFDESGTNRTRWTVEDMLHYQKYMCEELHDYLLQDE